MAKETAEEREMNQLMKVRMEKMAALEEKGISPFGENSYLRIISQKSLLIKTS